MMPAGRASRVPFANGHTSYSDSGRPHSMSDPRPVDHTDIWPQGYPDVRLTPDHRQLIDAVQAHPGLHDRERSILIWIIGHADPATRPYQALLSYNQFRIGRHRRMNAKPRIKRLIERGYIVRKAVPGDNSIFIINEFMLTPYIPITPAYHSLD